MFLRVLGPTIREAREGDGPGYVAHLNRHVAESGRDGSPHFAIRRDFADVDPTTLFGETWQRHPSQPGWRRTWLFLDLDGTIRGHVALEGPWIIAAIHRCLLAIGIERAHVRRGVGSTLLATAIAFARAQPGLRFVDLRVFASNAPARALYRKTGFVETGLTPEAFVLWDGTRIDDVSMVLALR